jgi:hypothetical protein
MKNPTMTQGESQRFDPIVAYPKLKRVTVGVASRKAEAGVNAKLGKCATSVFGTKDERFVLKDSRLRNDSLTQKTTRRRLQTS